MSTPAAEDAIRYEPDEPCPPLIALIVGAQGVMLALTTMVLVVAITARAGNQSESYLTWAVAASLIIGGLLTAMQAGRFGRLGAGHILIMGPTPSYVALAVLALTAGGPTLLASLTIAAGIFYTVMSLWLPLLRRIITPVVSGTVCMLIAATILPVALNRVDEVPENAPAAAGPVVALVTLAAVVVLSVRVSGSWRIWSPFVAIASGCLAAVPFGAYDVEHIRNAAWVGLPAAEFPGLDLTPGVEFWALLPGFVVVALVGCVKSIGDCVTIQQLSWRKPRVTDFRLVQASLNTNGLGILMSGIAGTPPTSVYESSSPSLISLTGVAARRVGYAIGLIMAMLALMPKVTAVLLAIPSPVMGAYLITAIGVLFGRGVQSMVADGLDRSKAITVGIAFSLGVGLDNQTVGAEVLGETWAPLLDNGLLAGTVAAVVLTRLAELSSRGRQARLEVGLHPSSVNKIDEFLRGFAADIGWNNAAAQRLRAAGEETLMSLLNQGDRTNEEAPPGPDRQHDEHPVADSADNSPSLIVVARNSGATVEMEYLAVFDEQNIEDRLAHLSEESQSVSDTENGEISLRLLRHYASSVHHQKFHGLDVVTVQVNAAA